MATSQEELDSKRFYSTLKKVVSGIVEHYTCDDEGYKITFSVDGEPFEVLFKFSLHPSSQLMTLYSKLAFTVDEDKRAAYATRICSLNYDRMYGATFDFAPDKGITVYRIAVPYKKSLISPELIEQVIRDTYATVMRYNQYLYDVARGIEAELPPEQG